MDRERVLDRLDHMLAAIAGIERLTAGQSLSDYLGSADAAAAVERYLERISEASRHLPEDLKGRFSSIPWRQVADLGNVLRHAYDQILDERIWQLVQHDLPMMKHVLVAMREHVEAQTRKKS